MNAKPLEKETQEELPEVNEKCGKCGAPMVVKTGRYGRFLACSSYPECKNTRPLSLGISCPESECSGEIVEKRSKKGRLFYGCTNYPKCSFVSWDKPVNKACPNCEANFLVEKVSKSEESTLKCVGCKAQFAAADIS